MTISADSLSIGELHNRMFEKFKIVHVNLDKSTKLI